MSTDTPVPTTHAFKKEPSNYKKNESFTVPEMLKFIEEYKEQNGNENFIEFKDKSIKESATNPKISFMSLNIKGGDKYKQQLRFKSKILSNSSSLRKSKEYNGTVANGYLVITNNVTQEKLKSIKETSKSIKNLKINAETGTDQFCELTEKIMNAIKAAIKEKVDEYKSGSNKDPAVFKAFMTVQKDDKGKNIYFTKAINTAVKTTRVNKETQEEEDLEYPEYYLRVPLSVDGKVEGIASDWTTKKSFKYDILKSFPKDLNSEPSHYEANINNMAQIMTPNSLFQTRYTVSCVSGADAVNIKLVAEEILLLPNPDKEVFSGNSAATNEFFLTADDEEDEAPQSAEVLDNEDMSAKIVKKVVKKDDKKDDKKEEDETPEEEIKTVKKVVKNDEVKAVVKKIVKVDKKPVEPIIEPENEEENEEEERAPTPPPAVKPTKMIKGKK